MPAYDSAIIQNLLAAADMATTNAAKGKAFEDLACYLLGLIPGVTITERNVLSTFQTEEVDIACWNEQDPAGLKSFNAIVLVECKNWSKAVGSQEVAWFLRKIEDRGLDFGVLIAANGITGEPADVTAAHQLIANSLPKKIRIVVITRVEIESLRSTDEFVEMIRRKVCQTVLSMTV